MIDERIDAQPPVWKPAKRRGYFERVISEGERTRREVKHPVYQVTTTYDSFPDALRVRKVMHEQLDSATDEVNALRQFAVMKEHGSQERVVFYDSKQKIKLTLLTGDTKKGIIRCLIGRAESTDLEHQESPEAAFVDLRYVNGNLVGGSFQAESAVNPVESIKPWSETFPELINYIRHQGPESQEETEIGTELNYGFRLSRFAGESSPPVQQAQELANAWTTQLIDSVPMDDRAEAVRLLSRFLWQKSLTASLLEKITSQKVDDTSQLKLNKDAFLSEVIQKEISVIKGESPTDYRQIFEIQRFGESDFNWREVEIDKKAADEGNNGEHKIVNHGVKEYGGEVDVQEYGFKVDRNNGTISIVCSIGEKPKWTSSFPLFLPHQEIVEDFQDPEKDFRGIKPKVGISFEKAPSTSA